MDQAGARAQVAAGTPATILSTANLLRDVTIRLDGSDVIIDAQASDIKALVQAIAKERSAPGDTTGTQYRTLWSELYRRFRVPSYARIKISQYPAVMAWLEEHQQRPGPGKAPDSNLRPAVPAQRARPPVFGDAPGSVHRLGGAR